MASIVQQIAVTVSSNVQSEEGFVRQGGQAVETQNLTSAVRSQATVYLEGAEVLETCEDGGQFYVLVGIDRARFAGDTERRLKAAIAELARAEEKAGLAEQAGRRWSAASIYWSTLALSTSMDEMATLIRVVGKRPVTGSWLSAEELRKKALAVSAKAKIVLRVEPEQGTERLRDAALSCLAAAGLPAAAQADSPEATITLKVFFEAPPVRMPGSNLVRATLTASLAHEEGLPIAAPVKGEVKADGMSEAGANADAVRKLSSGKVATVMDSLMKAAGWQGNTCAVGKP